MKLHAKSLPRGEIPRALLPAETRPAKAENVNSSAKRRHRDCENLHHSRHCGIVDEALDELYATARISARRSPWNGRGEAAEGLATFAIAPAIAIAVVSVGREQSQLPSKSHRSLVHSLFHSFIGPRISSPSVHPSPTLVWHYHYKNSSSLFNPVPKTTYFILQYLTQNFTKSSKKNTQFSTGSTSSYF